MAHTQNPATPNHDTPTYDAEFDLGVVIMSAQLALDAAKCGNTHDAGAYAKVAAEWLGRAHQQLTAVGVAR